MPVDPEPVPADTLWPDDYDEAQVLQLIRMWSGFESEMITDTGSCWPRWDLMMTTPTRTFQTG